jgi:hypothetical protein
MARDKAMGKVNPLNNKIEQLREAALEIARDGFPVFPCQYMRVGGKCSCRKGREVGKDGKPKCASGKHPATKNGFHDATIDESVIRQLWADKPYNIGLATGHIWRAATGDHKNVAVVDKDIANGKLGQQSLDKLTARYGPLPETRRVKTGSGGTHYYFLTRRPVKSFKADDKHCPLGPHIDVRGAGGYVLAPGSNHYSGDHYEWENPGSPIAPMPEWMEALLEYADAESTPAPINGTGPYDPNRDVFDAEAAKNTLEQFTDVELDDALDAIPADLITGYEAGSSQPGCWWEVGAALRNVLGEGALPRWMRWSERDPKWKTDYSKDADSLRQWKSDLERMWSTFRDSKYSMGTIIHYARENQKYKLPERILNARKDAKRNAEAILVTGQSSRATAAQTWDKLNVTETGSKALYLYGNQVARVEDGKIRVLNKEQLWQLVTARVDFQQWTKSNGYSNCDPPDNLIKYMANTPMEESPLPVIEGVTCVPVMLPDGSIHTAPGYSPVSKLFHAPNVEVGEIPKDPSKHDLEKASGLLKEAIQDFPYADLSGSDLAHALGMMILPFVRLMVGKGSTPIHLLHKPVAGTGATFLGQIITLIKTGEMYPAGNPPKREDEWSKRIVSKLSDRYAEFFFLDDVEHITSKDLATAVTSPDYEDRRLHSNEIIRVPVRCVWMFCGNNPDISTDNARRVVHIRLDAKMVDPTNGRTFRHPDLEGWVRRERGQLVTAILTLARAWVVAGKPKPSVTLASFDLWAWVIGGILGIAGVKGFLQTPKEEKEASNPMLEIENNFVTCWFAHVLYDKARYQGVKAAHLVGMVSESQLELDTNTRTYVTDRGLQTIIGNLLSRMRDKVYMVTEADFLAKNPMQVTVRVQQAGNGGSKRWLLAADSGVIEKLEKKHNEFWDGTAEWTMQAAGVKKGR